MKKQIALIVGILVAVAYGVTVRYQIGSFNVRLSKGAIEPSALFEVTATTKGAIPCPKMTTVQMNAISSPTEGLCVRNTTTGFVNFYRASAWRAFNAEDVSAFGLTLLDDADASAALTTLGVSTFIKTLLDDTSAITARATLGITNPWAAGNVTGATGAEISDIGGTFTSTRTGTGLYEITYTTGTGSATNTPQVVMIQCTEASACDSWAIGIGGGISDHRNGFQMQIRAGGVTVDRNFAFVVYAVP